MSNKKIHPRQQKLPSNHQRSRMKNDHNDDSRERRIVSKYERIRQERGEFDMEEMD